MTTTAQDVDPRLAPLPLRRRQSLPHLDDLAALPKAHLHLHLVGAMRRATLASLTSHLGPVSVPSVPRYTARSFARPCYLATAAIRTPEQLARLVDEIVADQAADGVWWVQITVDPLLYRGRLGSPADVLDMLIDFGMTSARRHLVGVGWVVCANRSSAPATADVARLAAERSHLGVVGLGLAGEEGCSTPGSFSRAFTLAAEAGLLLCPHAGELCGPRDVADAMHYLRPHRIGHALGAAVDPALLAELADDSVLVEGCRQAGQSNVALGLVPSLYHRRWAERVTIGCLRCYVVCRRRRECTSCSADQDVHASPPSRWPPTWWWTT
jgi:adenosine deaminase